MNTKKKFILLLIIITLMVSLTHALASTYLANTKSGKFHYSDCSTIKHPNAGHFVTYNSRESAIAAGYIPCKRCNP